MQVKLTALEDSCSKQLTSQKNLELVPPLGREFVNQVDSEVNDNLDWKSESESNCANH